MIWRMAILATIIIITTAGLANASFFDGNKLHEACTSSRPFVLGFSAGVSGQARISKHAYSNFYLAVIAPMVTAGQSTATLDKPYDNGWVAISGHCVPQDATLNQVADVYCQYLAATPGFRHLSAELLFNRALTATWPCR